MEKENSSFSINAFLKKIKSLFRRFHLIIYRFQDKNLL